MDASSSFGKPGQSSKQAKKAHQRKSLDAGGVRVPSGPPPPADTTHLLIVNGGGHDAFMGDFLGLVRFFEKRARPDFLGEFWTAAHPDAVLGDRTEIKFGGDGSVMANPEVVYTKGATAQNWVYVPPADIVRQVNGWMLPNAAKAGDSIVMIFIAHGAARTVNGKLVGHSMMLGDDLMSADDLVGRLRNFPPNIQVNVISTACYSGIFAEKIQIDGRERDGFKRLPTNTREPGLASCRSIKQDLERATQSHPDPAKKSTPAAYHDALESQAVESLLLRRFADFPVLEPNIAARRRVERTQQYLEAFSTPDPNSESVHIALQVIRGEADAFLRQSAGAYSDGYFASTGLRPDKAIPDMLRGLMWRGRHQSNVFQCFMQLCLQGVCHLSALSKPVNYSLSTPTVSDWIKWALSCWPLFDELEKTGREVGAIQNRYVDWQTFRAPFVWLGVMIARSAANLSDTFDIIVASNFFGTLDLDRMAELGDYPKAWEPDPNDSVAEGQIVAPYFGLMLPDSVDMDDPENSFKGIQRQFYERFSRVEHAYEIYFNIPENRRFSLSYQSDRELDVREYDLNVHQQS
ncbi:MAG: hypothetical protein Q9207_006253 [Kuettlingeria erythrocarpa]